MMALLIALVVGYVLFMLPGNIVLRWIPPNFVIGGCAIIFGALVCGLGGAKNYATVLGIRILIGFSQAFIQGLTVYTPLWFKRDEVASIAGEQQYPVLDIRRCD